MKQLKKGLKIVNYIFVHNSMAVNIMYFLHTTDGVATGKVGATQQVRWE